MTNLTPQQETEFLEKNKEILKVLLENCKAAIDKSDLQTFKKMIMEQKIFNCIMAASGLSYTCTLKISLTPLDEKKESDGK